MNLSLCSYNKYYVYKILSIMVKKKFNNWNNGPCRSIFYHVTQGSHRAALYCFYNFSDLFSEELKKRVLDFIFSYLFNHKKYNKKYNKFSSNEHLPSGIRLLPFHSQQNLLDFYQLFIEVNSVDIAVGSFIHQLILKFYVREKNK